MIERCEASFITTTSYGSWLPGDVRGYMENGELLPSTPPLASYAARRMKNPPVLFSDDDADALHDAIVAAAGEFDRHSSFAVGS